MTSLFKTPKLPAAKPTAPLLDEEMLAKKKKENIIKQSQRAGRASTILTDTEKLG